MLIILIAYLLLLWSRRKKRKTVIAAVAIVSLNSYGGDKSSSCNSQERGVGAFWLLRFLLLIDVSWRRWRREVVTAGAAVVKSIGR
jgi:hypothetical protein